jgi:hypothetical protein
MRLFIAILILGCISYGDGSTEDQNRTKKNMPILTKFQKRKLSIEKMRVNKEAEAKHLEEEGFCACSVQIP